MTTTKTEDRCVTILLHESEDGRQKYEVTAQLKTARDGSWQYFSVVYDKYEDGELIESGRPDIVATSPTVLRPDLAPLEDLHLCDSEGVPLHAVENGFYWLAGMFDPPLAKYSGADTSRAAVDPEYLSSLTDCTRTLSKHLRMDIHETDQVVSHIWTEGYDRWIKDAQLTSSGDKSYQEVQIEKAGELKTPEGCIQLGVFVKEVFAEWVETQRSRWKEDADNGIQLLDSLRKEVIPHRPR